MTTHDMSPEIARYLDDVHALACMASITSGIMADAFFAARATKGPGAGEMTFTLPERAVDDLLFAVSEILLRADSLDDRRPLHTGEGAR